MQLHELLLANSATQLKSCKRSNSIIEVINKLVVSNATTCLPDKNNLSYPDQRLDHKGLNKPNSRNAIYPMSLNYRMHELNSPAKIALILLRFPIYTKSPIKWS